MTGILALGLAVLAAPAAQSAPAPGCAASPRPASCIEGSWTGSFLQTDWTLEFRRVGSGWSGRYRTVRYNKWVDLRSVAVAGDVVTFAIEATPRCSFALKLDASGVNLAGEMRVEGHPPLPFAAVRDR